MPISGIPSQLKNIIERYRLVMQKQEGVGLVEAIVAVAIMGSTVFMLLSSLTTGAISVGIVQEDTVADNLGAGRPPHPIKDLVGQILADKASNIILPKYLR